jgi:soluble lytic murein transglycosylase-like protein
MLLDPCQNVMAGAFLLRKRVNEYGYNWRAVGAYHSKTPEINERYQIAVYSKWLELAKRAQVTSPPLSNKNATNIPEAFVTKR